MSGQLSGFELEVALCKAMGLPIAVTIATDPAVSEPEFLKFCAERRWRWQLSRTILTDPAQRFCVEILEPVVAALGKDPSEARARAMLAVLAAGW